MGRTVTKEILHLIESGNVNVGFPAWNISPLPPLPFGAQWHGVVTHETIIFGDLEETYSTSGLLAQHSFRGLKQRDIWTGFDTNDHSVRIDNTVDFGGDPINPFTNSFFIGWAGINGLIGTEAGFHDVALTWYGVAFPFPTLSGSFGPATYSFAPGRGSVHVQSVNDGAPEHGALLQVEAFAPQQASVAVVCTDDDGVLINRQYFACLAGIHPGDPGNNAPLADPSNYGELIKSGVSNAAPVVFNYKTNWRHYKLNGIDGLAEHLLDEKYIPVWSDGTQIQAAFTNEAFGLQGSSNLFTESGFTGSGSFTGDPGRLVAGRWNVSAGVTDVQRASVYLPVFVTLNNVPGWTVHLPSSGILTQSRSLTSPTGFQDWRPYRYLQLTYNASASVPAVLSVLNKTGGTKSYAITLQAGAAKVLLVDLRDPELINTIQRSGLKHLDATNQARQVDMPPPAPFNIVNATRFGGIGAATKIGLSGSQACDVTVLDARLVVKGEATFRPFSSSRQDSYGTVDYCDAFRTASTQYAPSVVSSLVTSQGLVLLSSNYVADPAWLLSTPVLGGIANFSLAGKRYKPIDISKGAIFGLRFTGLGPQGWRIPTGAVFPNDLTGEFLWGDCVSATSVPGRKALMRIERGSTFVSYLLTKGTGYGRYADSPIADAKTGSWNHYFPKHPAPQEKQVLLLSPSFRGAYWIGVGEVPGEGAIAIVSCRHGYLIGWTDDFGIVIRRAWFARSTANTLVSIDGTAGADWLALAADHEARVVSCVCLIGGQVFRFVSLSDGAYWKPHPVNQPLFSGVLMVKEVFNPRTLEWQMWRLDASTSQISGTASLRNGTVVASLPINEPTIAGFVADAFDAIYVLDGEACIDIVASAGSDRRRFRSLDEGRSFREVPIT